MTENLGRISQTVPSLGSIQSAEDLDKADPRTRNTAVSESQDEAPPGAPRWVKLFGIAAVVLLLLFAGMHLTGNGPMNMHGSTGAEHGMQAP